MFSIISNFFFERTFSLAQELQVYDVTQSRMETDIKEFITTYKDHVEPEAKNWLSFPHLACGLGDSTQGVSKAIATVLIVARKGGAAVASPFAE